MIYEIHNPSEEDVESIVIDVRDGDTIMVPDIRSMNMITSLLIEMKPDAMVYVRIPDEAIKKKPTRILKINKKSVYIDIPADVESEEYISSVREVILNPYTVDSKVFYMAYDVGTDTLYIRSV